MTSNFDSLRGAATVAPGSPAAAALAEIQQLIMLARLAIGDHLESSAEACLDEMERITDEALK